MMSNNMEILYIAFAILLLLIIIILIKLFSGKKAPDISPQMLDLKLDNSNRVIADIQTKMAPRLMRL